MYVYYGIVYIILIKYCIGYTSETHFNIDSNKIDNCRLSVYFFISDDECIFRICHV